jgi:hypothetical protein
MAGWEYVQVLWFLELNPEVKVVDQEGKLRTSMDSPMVIVNQLGADGWEAVGTWTDIRGNPRVLFKRVLP